MRELTEATQFYERQVPTPGAGFLDVLGHFHLDIGIGTSLLKSRLSCS